ncbi:hypothetical protein Tco_0643985 [Tanacetum coccineum]
MRSFRAVGSTIHSMIKFPTNQGVITMELVERPCENVHLERVQGSWREVQWRQREEKMSKIREQAILRVRSNSRRRPGLGLVSLEKTRSKEDIDFWQTFYGKTLRYSHGPDQKLQSFRGEGLIRKDMYPFSEEGEELASLIGYPYKCFLRLLKEYSHIRMAEEDEEKTGMMETVLADKRGRNVEIHLEDIVIKGKSEQNLISDVKETLRKLRRVNIKIDLTMPSFRVNEGKFLGHMVTEKGLRGDPERIQAIILIPTPRKLKHPPREARTRMETTKESVWTNEAEEVLQRIKRKLGKLQTLAILKEG